MTRDLRIAALRLNCSDPAATAAFYETAFGARREPMPDGLALALGRQRIELARTTARPGSPVPSNSTAFQHLALVVPDMEAAMDRLRAVSGWSPISQAGPERLPAASGGVTAFKFRDPDGHPLEFLSFPPESRPAVWQGGDGPVLGIDHTAVAVTDTERSVAFYARLGFAVASRGLNRGEEQARMDGVPAPVVEVTGLRLPGAPAPHLELLCYREPAMRTDVLADADVLATRTVIAGDEPRLVTDPDGHRWVVTAELAALASDPQPR